jgi:hypothetical protein
VIPSGHADVRCRDALRRHSPSSGQVGVRIRDRRVTGPHGVTGHKASTTRRLVPRERSTQGSSRSCSTSGRRR